MDRPTLRITVEEASTAVRLIDPVAVLAEELVGRTIGQPGWARRDDLARTGDGNGELRVPVDDVDCVLPAASVRTFQSAALAALAARELLVPGGVTAALVGTRDVVDAGLAIVARHVPDISHVAVYLSAPRHGVLDPGLLDQLELSGIGLSMVSELPQAVFGANLVVVTGELRADDLSDLLVGRLAAGTCRASSPTAWTRSTSTTSRCSTRPPTGTWCARTPTGPAGPAYPPSVPTSGSC